MAFLYYFKYDFNVAIAWMATLDIFILFVLRKIEFQEREEESVYQSDIVSL